MRPVIPVRDLQRRIPECGRIRTGVKTAKAMKALDVFRFTSADRDALEQVAAAYGGSVVEWKEPKAAPGQFEVITEAHEIRIVLPPDCLGSSPTYETWGGGGRERSCDGLSCTVIQSGPDGAEPAEVPCLCNAQGAMKCEPHTRLNVILPEVRFTGVWRLESKSWNVAQEFPGFVDLIQSVQDRGLTRGVLRLEKRTSVFAGQTRRFTVPVLGIAESMDALAAGLLNVSSIGAGSSAPMLPRGETRQDDDPLTKATCGGDAPYNDNDVIDAEIVDERTLADVVPASVTDGQALVAARRVAERHNEEQPTELAQVTDARRIAEVLDELGVLDGAT